VPADAHCVADTPTEFIDLLAPKRPQVSDYLWWVAESTRVGRDKLRAAEYHSTMCWSDPLPDRYFDDNDIDRFHCNNG